LAFFTTLGLTEDAGFAVAAVVLCGAGEAGALCGFDVFISVEFGIGVIIRGWGDSIAEFSGDKEVFRLFLAFSLFADGFIIGTVSVFCGAATIVCAVICITGSFGVSPVLLAAGGLGVRSDSTFVSGVNALGASASAIKSVCCTVVVLSGVFALLVSVRCSAIELIAPTLRTGLLRFFGVLLSLFIYSGCVT